jgi:putative sigma-54 modulation protein
MNTNVSFRHMESSPALRDYATGKLERVVGKYVHGKVDADVVMSVEKFWHIANFTLQIKNLTVKGQERSEDMYSSIDLALAKIEKQLRRHKDRLRDHKPTNGESKTFRMGVVSPLDAPSTPEEYDEFAEDFEVYSESSPAEPEPDETTTVENADGEEVKILRQKEYEAKSLNLSEAVIQLDLLEDREFYVFTNAASGDINVVYKRRDGNVGLIET